MKNYINNLETGKIELHFEKSEYLSLSAEQKTELKRFFSWSRYATAWVSKSSKDHYWALKIAAQLGFTEEEKQGKRLSYAEELERKAEKAENRAERMESHAVNAAKRAKGLQAEFNKYRQDWSWLTQPIIAGHAGSERFARQRQKVLNRYQKGFDEYRKSDYFKERAETARATASNAQLENPVYLDNRIRECQKNIRNLEKRVVENEEILHRIENGEEIKNYYDKVVTAEMVQHRLKELAESLEYEIDKKAFMRNALDKLKADGVNIYTKDDIKPGYLVKIRGHWCKVLSAGPKNVNAASQYSPWGITYPYAEIREFKIPADWTDPKKETHNVKEGEIFTRDNVSGTRIISAYQVIKTTAKTVQVKEIAVADNQTPIKDKFVSDKAERKTVKTKTDGTAVLIDEGWYLYRYTA